MSDDKKNITEEQVTTPETAPETIEIVTEVATAHDDFDWDKSDKHSLPYDDAQIQAYLADYESTLSSVKENEIVKAKVSAMSSSDVVLDINYKSDGLISLSEFRDTPDLKVGDEVEAVSYTHLTLPTICSV